jgi:predicted aspartyl protease
VSGYETEGKKVMGTDTMGRVLVRAKIENSDDLVLAKKGLLPAGKVRSVEVFDALVDTGATLLSMPKGLIEQLGLEPVRIRTALTSAGNVRVQIYGTARLTVEGRDCPIDVSELPDNGPVLIGQVTLELLDFVVDVPGQRLIGNPAHGGEHMIEMY